MSIKQRLADLAKEFEGYGPGHVAQVVHDWFETLEVRFENLEKADAGDTSGLVDKIKSEFADVLAGLKTDFERVEKAAALEIAELKEGFEARIKALEDAPLRGTPATTDAPETPAAPPAASGEAAPTADANAGNSSPAPAPGGAAPDAPVGDAATPTLGAPAA